MPGRGLWFFSNHEATPQDQSRGNLVAGAQITSQVAQVFRGVGAFVGALPFAITKSFVALHGIASKETKASHRVLNLLLAGVSIAEVVFLIYGAYHNVDCEAGEEWEQYCRNLAIVQSMVAGIALTLFGASSTAKVVKNPVPNAIDLENPLPAPALPQSSF